MNINEIKSKLGQRKQNHSLQQLRILIDFYQEEFKVTTDVSIAITHYTLQVALGVKYNQVSVLLEKAVRCGLLTVKDARYNTSYRDEWGNDIAAKARVYTTNPAIADVIVAHTIPVNRTIVNVDRYKVTEVSNIKVKGTSDVNNMEYTHIKRRVKDSERVYTSGSIKNAQYLINTYPRLLNSNLKSLYLSASDIKKPITQIDNNKINKINIKDISILGDRICLDDIYLAVMMQYPQILEIQKEIDDYNRTAPMKLNIRFIPHITVCRRADGRDQVTKIAIRATNSICNDKKVKQENGVEYKRTVRALLGDNYREYDIKNSIYRVTRLLNTGKWLDQDVDIYEKIFGSFESVEDRNTKKKSTMRLYFTTTVKQAVSRAKRAGDVTLTSESMYNQYHNNMVEFCGQGFDSEIFLHESIIYFRVYKKILEQQECVQVYDGFYTKEIIANADEIVKETAEQYYNEYI